MSYFYRQKELNINDCSSSVDLQSFTTIVKIVGSLLNSNQSFEILKNPSKELFFYILENNSKSNSEQTCLDKIILKALINNPEDNFIVNSVLKQMHSNVVKSLAILASENTEFNNIITNIVLSLSISNLCRETFISIKSLSSFISSKEQCDQHSLLQPTFNLFDNQINKILHDIVSNSPICNSLSFIAYNIFRLNILNIKKTLKEKSTKEIKPFLDSVFIKLQETYSKEAWEYEFNKLWYSSVINGIICNSEFSKIELLEIEKTAALTLENSKTNDCNSNLLAYFFKLLFDTNLIYLENNSCYTANTIKLSEDEVFEKLYLEELNKKKNLFNIQKILAI